MTVNWFDSFKAAIRRYSSNTDYREQMVHLLFKQCYSQKYKQIKTYLKSVSTPIVK